jgi:hypothetical protein
MKPIHFLLLGITCLFVACQQNDIPAPNAPCEWAVELVPITQDTCFFPLTDPFGYIIPPIEGYDIDQIALSNTQGDVLFFVDIDDEKMADLYQFNLCTNELQLLVTLEYYSNDHLRLNSKDQIIYIRTITPSEKELVFYDINEASITILSENSPYVNEIGWVTDTSFMVEEGINLNTNPSFGRVVYNTQNIALDTIYLGSGTFSNPFNDKIAINGFIPDNGGFQLFIYDIPSQTISEPYDIPHELFFKERYNLSWLNESQLLVLASFGVLGRFDIEDQTTDIFFSRSTPECSNVRYRKVGLPLGDGKHFLQIREEFFFNEEGEYRLRNDIIRYNMETGLEELIVLE